MKVLMKALYDINRRTHDGLEIRSRWEGQICDLTLHNPSDRPVPIGEIEVITCDNPFPPETVFYGEGYNKLAQYRGTADDFQMFASHGDFTHYRLPKPDGWRQAYNMLLAHQPHGEDTLIGFASCRRFTGIFRFHEREFKVLLDGENKKIMPGETLELEQLFIGTGRKNGLLDQFAAAISRNHPRLEATIPTGWSSWTVYGPSVTEENILDTLRAIRQKDLPLKYIQIDDGYQPYMGDWLSTTDKFAGGLSRICRKIKEEGFEPAIWAAPFIAEKDSRLFREHPDWFVKDDSGLPLPADRVSFGGWRCAPWYMLDGTHPEARRYLTRVFRTMREEWGITYFKLDANMWGALPFGHRYDDNCTCVEAYRIGMEAVLEGAGKDSFLLGCNAPMWPSLGTVHGMRVTNDNIRDFRQFRQLARECFPRNWQHGRLWINDPDTVLLQNLDTEVMDPAGQPVIPKGDVTENEFLFNAAYTAASGGMVLSGDDITELTEKNTALLQKLLSPSGIPAVFDDEEYEIGRAVISEDKQILYLFNYGETPKDYTVDLVDLCPADPDTVIRMEDFWTGRELGTCRGCMEIRSVPARSARVIICTAVR